MSEPTSLVISLSSLKTADKSKKLSKSKSRSRSVPQLASLLNAPDANQKNTSNVEALIETDENSLKNQTDSDDKASEAQQALPVFSIDLKETDNASANDLIFTLNDNIQPLTANITDDEKYQQIASTNPRKSQNNGFNFFEFF